MRNISYLAAALGLTAAAMISSGQTVSASPSNTIPLQTTETGNTNIQKAGYWHSRWRSHYRWGSYGYWHNRWRSHWRWGSRGYWHNRWRSHYRWGSRW